MSEAQIPVKYIGPDPYWHGLLYNARLRFEQGQTLHLPEALALKFLTHKDTFGPGDGETKPLTADEASAAALAEAEKAKKQQEEQQTEVYDLFAQIDLMDKASLTQVAEKYGQAIDKRRGLDALRSEVKGFVDRFGAL